MLHRLRPFCFLALLGLGGCASPPPRPTNFPLPPPAPADPASLTGLCGLDDQLAHVVQSGKLLSNELMLASQRLDPAEQPSASEVNLATSQIQSVARNIFSQHVLLRSVHAFLRRNLPQPTLDAAVNWYRSKASSRFVLARKQLQSRVGQKRLLAFLATRQKRILSVQHRARLQNLVELRPDLALATRLAFDSTTVLWESTTSLLPNALRSALTQDVEQRRAGRKAFAARQRRTLFVEYDAALTDIDPTGALLQEQLAFWQSDLGRKTRQALLDAADETLFAARKSAMHQVRQLQGTSKGPALP